MVERLPFGRLGEAMSRREMIGVTAALLPVVLSIAAPTPAMAQTRPPGVGFDFTPFNGLYNGNGTPGTPNTCNFSGRPVTLTLNVVGTSATTGTGSLIIVHTGATTFTTIPATAIVQSANVINVTGPGAGGVFTTTNNFTFTRTGATAVSVTGAQQLIYVECGTTPYNITASKP